MDGTSSLDRLPPSPSFSPLSSPAALDPSENLKTSAGTQPVTSFAHTWPLAETYVDQWDKRYNRRSVPLMAREDLEELIVAAYREAGARGVKEVEAEVARRLQQQTAELEQRMEDRKLDFVLALVESKIPFNVITPIRTTTVLGHAQFVTDTLSFLQAHAAQALADAKRMQAQAKPKSARHSRPRKKADPGDITSVRRSGRIAKRNNP